MKTPALIHQSGLAQALVFLQSRDGDVGKLFVQDLAETLNRDDCNNAEKLVAKALKAELTEYMVLTSDIEAVAAWFRRFAQIELKQPDGDNDAP